MLLLPIEHEFHRRASLLRKRNGYDSEISCSEFRAEAAAHKFGDHTDFAFRNLKDLCHFIADSGGSLCGGIYRQQIRLPVGNYSVGLERTVSLYLGLVIAFDHNVSFGESLFRAALFGASRSKCRTANVAALRNVLCATSAASATTHLRRGRIDQGRIRLSRFFDRCHEGKHFVVNLHQFGGFVGGSLRCSRDSPHRLSGKPDDGEFRWQLLGWIFHLRHVPQMAEDVHAFHSGILLGLRGVDGTDARVGHGRAHHLSIEHAG